MRLTWKVSKTHSDPFSACPQRCQLEFLSGVPCSSEGGNDYACTECGMEWRQLEHGVLISPIGKINLPLDEEGDVICQEDPLEEQ